MVAISYTIAFIGIEGKEIEVQCSLSSGLPAFNIVGLADKTVAESKERIRSAFYSAGIALPAKRITVNLAPADMPKEGSHYDLPIAVALLASMEIISEHELSNYTILGELSLNGRINPVFGAISAAISTASTSRTLICPAASAKEAAIVGTISIIAPETLIELINHLTGKHIIPPPSPSNAVEYIDATYDFSDIRGQETAKRALEIAAAGGHNVLLSGPPGSGKSMLANRFPSILPYLTAEEALEVMQIYSLSGLLSSDNPIPHKRPFRNPHHTASPSAIIGGGRPVKPGEVTLAHNGVLFLDELPEFPPHVLDTLRQPMETGSVTIARVHSKVVYPARNQLIAAMNPCKCGYLNDPLRACPKSPMCASTYQNRISGPLLDRIDIFIDVPPVNLMQLSQQSQSESSATILTRVINARNIQTSKFSEIHKTMPCIKLRTNSDLRGSVIDRLIHPDKKALQLMQQAGEKMMLTARGYNRTLCLAQTIADLDQSEEIKYHHVAEALTLHKNSFL